MATKQTQCADLIDDGDGLSVKYIVINKRREYIDHDNYPIKAGASPRLVDGGEQCDGCGQDIGESGHYTASLRYVDCDCGQRFEIKDHN